MSSGAQTDSIYIEVTRDLVQQKSPTFGIFASLEPFSTIVLVSIGYQTRPFGTSRKILTEWGSATSHLGIPGSPFFFQIHPSIESPRPTGFLSADV